MRKIYVLDYDDQIDPKFDPIILEDGNDPEKVIRGWMSKNYGEFRGKTEGGDDFESECEQTETDEEGIFYDAEVSYSEYTIYPARFKLIEE